MNEKRKILQINRFCGLDKRENTALFEPGGLLHSKNLLYKNGALRKRGGAREAYRFTDNDLRPVAIDGLFEYDDYIIAYAGGEFYKCERELASVQKIPKSANVNPLKKRCFGTQLGKYLVIAGAGELLFYDGERISLLKDAPFIYVPTTSQNGRNSYYKFSREINEQPNALFGRRKNTLRGTDVFMYGDAGSEFRLDSKIKYNTPFFASVKIRVRRSNDLADYQTTHIIGVGENGEDTNCVITVKFSYPNGIGDGQVCKITEPLVSEMGETVRVRDPHAYDTVYDYTDLDWSLCVLDGDRLRFNFEVKSYDYYVDNIEVEYEGWLDISDTSVKNATDIKSTLGKDGSDVMILAFEDRVMISDSSVGIGYFPLSCVIKTEGNNGAVTSVAPLSQSHVAIFKENSFAYASIEREARGFTLYPTQDTVGAINCFVTKNLKSDLITLGESLYGVDDVSTSEIKTKYLTKRGSKIDSLIRSYTKEQRREAVSALHDGIYYLFIGDGAFCTDVSERIDGEYAWYYLDGLSACAALSSGGTLYMGTSDGAVRILTNDPYDESICALFSQRGDFLAHYNEDGLCVVIDFEYGIESGARVRLNSQFTEWASDREYAGYFDVGKELFGEDGSVVIYEGQKLAILQNGYVASYTEVSEVDLLNGQIKVQSEDTLAIGEHYDIYVFKMNEEYVLEEQDGEYRVLLNGRGVKIIPNTLTKIEVVSKRQIDTEMITSPSYLSSLLSGKRLHSVLVKFTNDTCADIFVGYISEGSGQEKRITVTPKTTPDNLDFNTLDTEAGQKQRQLNFSTRRQAQLGVSIRSSAPLSIGIEQITLIYTEGARIRAQI